MMDTNYTLTRNNKIVPMILVAVGLVAIALGFASGDTTRTWAALLHNNFYFMSMALVATFFVALQYVAQAGWAIAFVRIPEAMTGYLKYAMGFMLLIFAFGHHDLYHWTHHELYEQFLPDGKTPNPEFDHILAGKSGFLNVPFYIVRILLYAAIWVGFAFMLRKNSLQEDLNGGLSYYKRNITLGAIFLVMFAVTSSTSAWDFLMSIDAHWFSTLFAWDI